MTEHEDRMYHALKALIAELGEDFSPNESAEKAMQLAVVAVALMEASIYDR